MSHTSFATTTRGLNRDLPPMRLFEKAKKLGIWNPSDIDFSKDKQHWCGMENFLTLCMLQYYFTPSRIWNVFIK